MLKLLFSFTKMQMKTAKHPCKISIKRQSHYNRQTKHKTQSSKYLHLLTNHVYVATNHHNLPLLISSSHRYKTTYIIVAFPLQKNAGRFDHFCSLSEKKLSLQVKNRILFCK